MIRPFATLALLVGLQGMPLIGAADDHVVPPIDPRGIPGTLVISGGNPLPPKAMERFITAAGGKSAKLVIVSIGKNNVDHDEVVCAPWKQHDLAALTFLPLRSLDESGVEDVVAHLRMATAVWLEGAGPPQFATPHYAALVERELKALLERGGVVGGTSATAAILSRTIWYEGSSPEFTTGFDLLPGAVIAPHFDEEGSPSQLSAVLQRLPGHWGVGVPEGAAIVIRGRRMNVLGQSNITVALAGSEMRRASEISLKPGDVADVTALRRAALARAMPTFPPLQCEPTRVPHGALMIVGGGAMTPDMIDRFIELAGGRHAPLVVIPSADANPQPEEDRMAQALRRAGASSVEVLHARSLEEVESPWFRDTLRRARGVWFGGGRQWRLVDAYAGTSAESLFHDVLRRGGVIGGSSAGASIQAEYLVRGSPLDNRIMMAEGYERGFGFLPGTAIDQHFSQRNRFADLESVVKAFPQLLGIGIDESAALVVQGSVAEVIGKHEAHFYHCDLAGNLQRARVGPGGRYNLIERVVLHAPAGGE